MLLSPIKISDEAEEEKARPHMLPVAVKKTSLTQQRKRRIEVFKRELRALQRIKHEGVVQLIAIGKDPNDEFIFAVLEKCDCSGWQYV